MAGRQEWGPHRFTRLVSEAGMHVEHEVMKVHPPASEFPG